MIIDGKKIAEEIKEDLHIKTTERKNQLKLAVIVAHDTAEIHAFVELKRRFGKDINVKVDVLELKAMEQTDEKLLQRVLHATKDYDGIIVQLPLPPKYNKEQLLNFLPLSHDVDVIGKMAYGQFEEHRLPFFPPVIGAFSEVLKRQGINLVGHKVLIVGEGRLVGAPAAIWARYLGATVITANKNTENLSEATLGAEVIILGAGSPNLLTPDMISPGVHILDAGTSEEAGVLKGDADPACAEKAATFTPNPGGIGPITVAKVFENLLKLDEIKHRNRE